jgi:hypothetical protein
MLLHSKFISSLCFFIGPGDHNRLLLHFRHPTHSLYDDSSPPSSPSPRSHRSLTLIHPLSALRPLVANSCDWPRLKMNRPTSHHSTLLQSLHYSVRVQTFTRCRVHIRHNVSAMIPLVSQEDDWRTVQDVHLEPTIRRRCIQLSSFAVRCSLIKYFYSRRGTKKDPKRICTILYG